MVLVVLVMVLHARTHVHTYTRTHTHTIDSSRLTRTCDADGHTHTHTRTRTRTHMHARAHTHMHAHTRTHMHARTHAHKRTHACTHTHANTHARAHKHTHTHMHTYIHTYIHFICLSMCANSVHSPPVPLCRNTNPSLWQTRWERCKSSRCHPGSRASAWPTIPFAQHLRVHKTEAKQQPLTLNLNFTYFKGKYSLPPPRLGRSDSLSDVVLGMCRNLRRLDGRLVGSWLG